MKCESESSLNFIISANHGSHCYCSPPRHRIELHFLALCCWVGPNDKFILQGKEKSESEMSRPFSSTFMCLKGEI